MSYSRYNPPVQTDIVEIGDEEYEVDFQVCPPEPDVGLMGHWISIEHVRQSGAAVHAGDALTDRLRDALEEEYL